MKNERTTTIAQLYLAAMFIAYPLAFHDKYFDISYTKLTVFLITSVAMIIATLIQLFMNGKESIGAIYRKCRIEIILLGITAVSFVCCFLINGHSIRMLVAPAEHGTGLFVLIVILCASFCMLYLNECYSSELFAILVAVGGIIGLFVSLLQFAGVDVGHMIEPISENEQGVFLGPLGNIAYTGLYAVVVCPFSIYVLALGDLYRKGEKGRIISIAYIVAGVLGVYLSAVGVIISNTDGTLLAFAVAVVVLGSIMLKDEKKSYVFYISLMAIGCGFGTVGIIGRVDPVARYLDSNQNLLVHPIVVFIILAIGLVGVFLKSRILIDSIISKACMVGIVLLCLLPLIIIVYTIVPAFNANTFGGNLLFFDNHWGTDRGYLWKCGIKIFASGSPLQMIFGQGPESFANNFVEHYYEKTYELGLFQNYDAHNIYLQFLCEYGAVALISVVSLLVIRIKKGISSIDLFDQVKAVALISAMVASLFLVFQNITLAFLPVLL